MPCGTALSAGPNLRAQSKQQPLPQRAHLLNHKQCPCAPKRVSAHPLQRGNANSTALQSLPTSLLLWLGAVGRCLWLILPGYVWSSSVDAEGLCCWSSSFLQGSALSAAPGRASKSQTSKGSTRGEESNDAQAGSCSMRKH